MPGQQTKKTAEQEALGALVTGANNIEAPFDGYVSGVTYTPVAGVTGAASPSSRTLSVINHGQAGSGTAVVASLALLSGVNLTAFDEKDVTLSVTTADKRIVAGDILEFRSAPVGGTGLADPGGTIEITFARDN
jgi:hypothetical protein